jgi:nitrous oxidase accessory protein
MDASTFAGAAPVAIEPRAGTRALAWRERLGGPWTRPIATIVGAALLVLAGFMPVWGTRLVAPQYPKGLDLWFYGDRVEGPVREVNGLNHYIGMQAIDLSQVPEMVLWPLAVVGPAFLLVIAVLWSGWLSRLALIGLWLVPVVILLDIQRWLIAFGTTLDPRAALRLEGFTPLVVGPTQVWNFSILTYPGLALILMWVVALIATLARRARAPEPRVRWITAAVAMVMALAGAALVLPGPAAAHGPASGHDPAASAGGSTAHGPDHAPSTEATGPPVDPFDLQAVVDGAPPGSTVTVPAGSYRTHLVIDKPLTLVAAGDAVLDGSGLGSVVTITADDVTLRGLAIGGTGGQVEVGSAIKVVEADGVVVEQNHLHDFFHGITVLGSTNVRIADNVLVGTGNRLEAHDHLASGGLVESAPVVVGTDPRAIAADASGAGPQGQGDGISIWNSRAATVSRNTISDVRDAVYLSYVEDALVDGNAVERSRYAVHAMFGGPVTVFGNTARGNLAGLVFMYTADVLAGRNLIEDQRSVGTGVGVVIKDVKGIRLAENVIARNRIGLKAEGTRRSSDREAAILRNRFDSNETAVTLFPSADLGFAANTFEGNLTDVHADDRGVARSNDWTYQGTGNRWASYVGYDLDADQVGDVPHTASGALQLILSDVPALTLYRGSPALHALDSAQELWESDRDMVISDLAPRLGDHAPLARDLDPEAVQSASVAGEAGGWYLTGISLAALALIGATALRLRGRGARP